MFGCELASESYEFSLLETDNLFDERWNLIDEWQAYRIYLLNTLISQY